MTLGIFRRGRFIACLAVLLAALFTPAAAQVRVVDERTMTANDGTVFAVTQARVRVPELRSGRRPAAVIDLAVVRVRPQGQGKAHVVLAGGPGASGVDEVLNLARQGGAAWFALMGGDVLGIDQRGTGASRPNLASNVRYNLPLDQPGSPEAWLPLIREASRLEAARLKAEGVNLQAYNTQESADDVDAVRRAFGYDKVILWGRSYGSHLALATLRRHPDGVERAILVSPEGPDHTWKLPAQIDRVLERVAARAASPELIANIRKVLADLSRAPESVAIIDPKAGGGLTIVLGKFDVQLVLAQALGDPRALAGLPQAFRQMVAGNYRTMGQLAFASRSSMGIQSAMKQAMDLSSGASEHRRRLIQNEAKTALLGNAMNFPGMDLATAWQVAPLPAAFRTPVRSSIPVLIVVGDLDVRTPVANAEEIAATLTRSHIVVVENAAHEFSLFGSQSLRKLLDGFLSGRPMEETTVMLPALPFSR
jgi:pimeloyl-ACP methyl ester carboxylesterase